MSALVFCVVLAAAALHATWNALVKHGGDPFMRLALVSLTAALAVVPVLPFVELPPAEAWPWLVGSLVTHIAYYLFLGLAYRSGDLSLVYPIARGVAPPLVGLLGFLVAGEALGLLGTLAVGMITLGILVLALGGGGHALDRRATVLPALACGVSIALYTICDGMGGRASGTPWGYIAWLFFLDGFVFSAAVFWYQRRELRQRLRLGLGPAALGGLLSLAAYALVIWAMTQAPMALVSALRETSVVLAALIGTRLLGEPYGTRRLVSAGLVALGVGMLEVARLL